MEHQLKFSLEHQLQFSTEHQSQFSTQLHERVGINAVYLHFLFIGALPDKQGRQLCTRSQLDD